MAVNVDRQCASYELPCRGGALSVANRIGTTRRRPASGERRQRACGKDRAPCHRHGRRDVDEPSVAQLIQPAGGIIDEPAPLADKPHRTGRRRYGCRGEHLNAGRRVIRQAAETADRLLEQQKIIMALGHIDRRDPTGDFDFGTIEQIRAASGQVGPFQLHRE